MTESYKQLYQQLSNSEFGCVPPGFHETEDVYQKVQETYPGLCDDSILCSEICSGGSNQAEWKHRVRNLQQALQRQSSSRLRSLSKGWYYEPKAIEITPVPDPEPSFEIGANYNRWELHDIFGGQRYSGIATPADCPVLFIFTGDSGGSVQISWFHAKLKDSSQSSAVSGST